MHLSLDSMTRRPRLFQSSLKKLWTKISYPVYVEELWIRMKVWWKVWPLFCFVVLSYLFGKDVFFSFSDPDTFFFRTRTQKIDEKRKQTQNAWDLVCAGFTNGSHSKKLNGSWCLGGEFCSFLEAFHGLWVTNSCRRPILKSKVFKCMFALRISLCVKPCKKAPRTVSTKGTSDIVSWRVDYSTLL